MNTCAECLNGKNNNGRYIYCILKGIMVRANYDHCEYHIDKKPMQLPAGSIPAPFHFNKDGGDT